MKISVPYLSQHLDVKDEAWRGRACSVACLSMVLKYLNALGGDSADEILWETFEVGGFAESGYWKHDSLVIVAHNHGVHAYRQEFKSILPNVEKNLVKDGLQKIASELRKGRPVFVSSYRKWEKGNSFHSIVLTGLTEGRGKEAGFYYHDPDSFSEEEGAYQFVPLELFEERWRKLAIFFSE